MQYLPPANMSPIRPETGRGRLTIAVLLLGMAALGVYYAWDLNRRAHERERVEQGQREEARLRARAGQQREAASKAPAARSARVQKAPAESDLDRTIDDLLLKLQSDDEKTRRNAKITLTALGVDAIPRLTDAAEEVAETDPELRQEIVGVLRSIIAAHRRAIESE